MRYSNLLLAIFSAVLVAACATPAAPDSNPQNLNDTPDLSAFRRVELNANATGKHESAGASFVATGAYLDVSLAGAQTQRLYVQAEQCRNDANADCPRQYALSGELNAFSSQLKCYIQIRNDANSGYSGQALQGICNDQYRRSYAITISK